MHPIAPRPFVTDAAADYVVLRDGSVASVRPAASSDADAIRRFFAALSPESRRRRFFVSGEAPPSALALLSGTSDPDKGLTLLVWRSAGEETRVIAVGSYFQTTDRAAEVAFAVADDLQGNGLGTALLERLAVVASERGFRRFEATTLADNAAMLDVFRDSGFEIRSKTEAGTIDVQLSLTPGSGSAAAEEERQRVATAASLRPLLEPRAVAIVGASREPSSIGHRVLEAVRSAGFKGPIYPVNRHGGELADLTVYTSARDLPAGVDLAIVTVPSQAVLSVVDDCAAAHVRSLVVITAGFAEAGPEGRALQDQLTTKVRAYGMRMVGPNCMGLINANPGVSLNASFSPLVPPAGHIGLLSQSGALGLAILGFARQRGLGLSTFVSAGNKADVSGNDLLEYWDSDPTTNVILLYIESFGNPKRFARLARRISRRKPIIAVKSGRSRSGTRAASSHTAALAANDVAVDALFHQSGVIRADTLGEMFDIAALVATQPLPSGRRVAIVTNAGGPAILAADACEAAGLVLSSFNDETRARLAQALPPMASSVNPVDMIASAGPDAYRRTLESVLASDDVDAVIVIFTPVDLVGAGAVIQAIRDGVAGGRASGGAGKPVVACVMAEGGQPPPIDCPGEQLPAYAFPENAAHALGKAATHAEWTRQQPGLLWGFDDLQVDDARDACRTALAERGETWLQGDEVHRVLNAFRFPLIAGTLCRTPNEAAAFAATIGFPVVAKVSSAAIQHKSDIGGVRINLADGPSVQQAFADILAAIRRHAPEAPFDGVTIQPMLLAGVETMMGIVQDPLFGPLIGFGLGGVHAEILGDVRFRIAPLTDRDVDELLREIKGFRLLEGYRGHAPADVLALRELLLRLSRLADEIPEIAELDLNPVIALPPGHGCRVVDARIRVRQPRTR